MATVDWYFDFISPFAYLQSEQLRLLGPKTRIRYRPVLFAGLLAAHAHKGPAEIPRKRAFTYRFARVAGEAPGDPVQDAARASVQSAAAPAPGHRLRLRARGGAPRSSASCGATVACPTCRSNGPSSSHDLRLPDAERRIADPEVKDALRRNTDEAIARGVFGVPTLVVGDELFWGIDATQMAADYLAQGGAGRIPSTSASARCRSARAQGAKPNSAEPGEDRREESVRRSAWRRVDFARARNPERCA